MASKENSALFVCLGNICRSPIAEAVFRHLVTQRGLADKWDIDSAATADYHTGANPDKRARECMRRHQVPMDHRARQVNIRIEMDQEVAQRISLKKDDYTRFQYIFGMDDDNIDDIENMAPKSHSTKIELLGKYDPENNRIIRDPYYDSNEKGFEEVYQQCLRCCQAFLDKSS